MLVVGARSHIGLGRHNNEDALYAGSHLIAVADGVGGAAGGEIASAVAITALKALDVAGIPDPKSALQQAANRAVSAIREAVARDITLSGMATTLTAVLTTATSMTLAHVGDSRAYRLRAGRLSQLTRDHTLVQSLIESGEITEAEARTHPRRSWITRALDGDSDPDLDLAAIDCRLGDRYLVCTDGLSTYVGDRDIAASLDGDDPQIAADRLVDLALEAGGSDNITCVVADPYPLTAPLSTKPPRNKRDIAR